MEVTSLGMEGLLLLSPRKFEDERGFFFEAWRKDAFDRLIGRSIDFVQDNVSFSRGGVLRGLHFQREPAAQGKLVSVSSGRIFDVAVDLRLGSLTFGQHAAVELSSQDNRKLWVPEGFAHGFLVLSEEATVHYKTTHPYAPEHEGAVRWDDPDLAIEWPLSGVKPIISPKDRMALQLADLAI